MKKIIALTLIVLLTGCRKSQANREWLYKQTLADTNEALTEAQDRAAAYQAQAERLAKLYHKHSGHLPRKDKTKKK